MKLKYFVLSFLLPVVGFSQILPSWSESKNVPNYIEKAIDATDVRYIYPNGGVPSDSKSWPWHEQTTMTPEGKMARNIVLPTVTMFKPAQGTANGTSLIIGPGGAFHILMTDKEGYEIARWATKLGITAFVLKYRVQHTPDNESDLSTFMTQLGKELPSVSQTEIYPPMSHEGAEQARLWGEEDGRQAIRYLRQYAQELGIEPNKIGIMGFSAGGGIAVNTALKFDTRSRPDFVASIYGGYRIVSPIPTNLPPMFIAITNDDQYVAPISSARLFEDWHKLGASVELHIFANGKHGFGMNKQNVLAYQWVELFKTWMTVQGFLPSAK